MNLAALPVLIAYFGTPFFCIFFWVRYGRPAMWPMLAAIALWLLQAGVLIYSIAICLSGHCQVAKTWEYMVYGLMAVAYIGIGILLWLSARRSTTSPSG